MSLEQRRDERRAQQSWWPFPTKNTLDRATAMIPKLLYQRMEELGLDFSVLYPTQGLGIYAIRNDEMRRATCHAFNLYIADAFHEFAARLTPAAMIPMNTPAEAIAELEHAKQIGLKAIVMGSLIRRPIRAYAGQRRTSNRAWYDVLGSTANTTTMRSGISALSWDSRRLSTVPDAASGCECRHRISHTITSATSRAPARRSARPCLWAG